jgi:hypothetical protein
MSIGKKYRLLEAVQKEWLLETEDERAAVHLNAGDVYQSVQRKVPEDLKLRLLLGTFTMIWRCVLQETVSLWLL